ncbi:MAG TPA: hypothetical protein VJ850_08435 [Candidatus Limnocylindrales bacterium]|nr:hypothetical protein [Candidatus Limnocylindrales bacterium]
MSTVPVSATLDANHVKEARARAGEGGFSKYLDEALAIRLQHDRLVDLEGELEQEFGPIPEASRRRIAAMRWPE